MDITQFDVTTKLNETGQGVTDSCRTRHAVFSECPHCGSSLHAEHAHFKCGSCGWRDSCCD